MFISSELSWTWRQNISRWASKLCHVTSGGIQGWGGLFYVLLDLHRYEKRVAAPLSAQLSPSPCHGSEFKFVVQEEMGAGFVYFTAAPQGPQSQVDNELCVFLLTFR